ncbi:MAG: phosphomannomutase/phosphoglucomutase [Myxococcales bacterium]|nr:phosphomannomutase/phosphoglucomutase [Myxococcales bacterium]MCB9541030.1 phosphomannomutase/phosphoglucomutase [Myxococcales bacterium]
MSSVSAVFRAYDIRGRADVELTDDFARALGRAYGETIAEAGGARVAVGRDCRTHGVRIAAAFEAGVCDAGVDVVHLGMVPTPLVYFAIHDGRLDGGVAVTGSHNPPDWNGFKLCVGTASMHGEAIEALRDRMAAGPGAAPKRRGELVEVDIMPRYLERLKTSLRPLHHPVTVVVDAGNGAGGPAAVAALRALGATVHPLYCEPDGRFPNHHPDPTVEANLDDLKTTVAAHGADLGVALDGDADRLGAVDRHGRVVWGDQLLLYFARALLAEQPGARIVGEVKCSRVLFDGVRDAGGAPEMWKVGHSLIKARMKETGAALAGEMSGHLFFADRYYGYDDAIYAAARLVERIGRDGPALDAFVDALPPTVATPELRVACRDSEKFAVVARAAAHFGARYPVVAVDGVRIDFPHGWGLVRASNTQPVLVMRFESDSEAHLAAARAEVEAWLAAHAPEVDLAADPNH